MNTSLLRVALFLLLAAPAPLLAHGATAGSKPLTPAVLRLAHRTPAEIVSLFAREAPPTTPREIPRAARAGNRESLLPEGIDAVMRTAGRDELVIVGDEERILELSDCIQVIDVAPEPLATGRQRLTLSLRRADPRTLRTEVRSREGSVQLNGKQVVLEGSPAWLHSALRAVIRGELAPVERKPVTPTL